MELGAANNVFSWFKPALKSPCVLSTRFTTRKKALLDLIEWASGRVGEWASGRVGEWASGRVGEWASGRVGEWASGRVGEWASGRVGEWASGRVGEWASGRVGEWASGRVFEWASVRVGECVGEWVKKMEKNKNRCCLTFLYTNLIIYEETTSIFEVLEMGIAQLGHEFDWLTRVVYVFC